MINAEKILVGFIFSSSWENFQLFSKSHWYDDFFKIGLQLQRLRGYFWGQISGLNFFFFRIICKGISLVNWRWVQFFGELFYWSDSFKVISYITLCKIELSPKGDRKKFKTISYVKLKMSSMSKFRIFMVDGVPEGSQDYQNYFDIYLRHID